MSRSTARTSVRRPDTLTGVLCATLAAEVFASLMLGAYPVPPDHLLHILAALVLPWSLPAHPDWSLTEQAVVQSIRLPRILLAAFAGGGLGLSGAALQGLFRNPLIGPDILGVSGGAACGGVLAILLDLPGVAIVGCAFAGGMAAVGLAAGIAGAIGGRSILVIALSGIIVGGFFSALLTLAEYVADPQSTLPTIVYWLLGSFTGADRTKLSIMMVVTLAGGMVLLGLRWRINLLSLGDTDAAVLGVRPAPMRWVVLTLVALIVAAQVSVSGMIGWVGLIVPHMARMLVGPDHRRLLPASALIGAGFLLAVDDVARNVATQELPIGLITALMGTPAFALLLWRNQRHGWKDE